MGSLQSEWARVGFELYRNLLIFQGLQIYPNIPTNARYPQLGRSGR